MKPPGRTRPRRGQHLRQILHRAISVLRREHRAIANAAGRAGHGIQLPQMELREHPAQNVDILAERGLRRAEHLAECAEREDFYSGIPPESLSWRQVAVAADAVHVHPPPNTNVKVSLLLL